MIGASLAGILAAAGGGATNIQFVGGVAAGTVGTTGSWTVSLTGLTGGIASAPAAGDFVVVFYGNADTIERSLSVVSAGYTVRANLFGVDSRESNMVLATKTLSTAETSVTLSGTGDLANAGAAVVLIYRGVDPVTPLDVPVRVVERTGGGNSYLPNPPAITPVTPGAWVVAGGVAQHNENTALVISSPDLSPFFWATAYDSRDALAGAGHLGPVSGTVDPAKFLSSVGDDAGSSFCAATLALRPAS